MSENNVNALRILLSEIIDYAGLFPPSGLSMTTAAQNYAKYLKGEHAWMLGRFIVPDNRLDELVSKAEKLLTKKNPWRLSVLVNNDLAETLSQITEFNQKYEGRAAIDTIEIKAEESRDITNAAKLLPNKLTAYFEIPPTEVLTNFMTALALTRTRAKIRTGGLTQDAFPPTDYIVKFMRVCTAANVPFKATAGLHHPLRCVKPLTYEKDAPNATMHGFLNVFLSAAYLRQDVNNSFVHKLMNEMDTQNLVIGEEEISWDGHKLEADLLNLTRQRNAISFGSCSFSEPIEDLQHLNLL
jgi:hypothetical protein